MLTIRSRSHKQSKIHSKQLFQYSYFLNISLWKYFSLGGQDFRLCIQGEIIIEDLLFENCSIYNSSLFSLQKNLNKEHQITISYAEINQCSFDHSYFLISNNKFQIKASNLQFHNNKLSNSVIIAFNNNIELLTVRTSNNSLIESSIIQTLLEVNFQMLLCRIEDLEDNFSAFQESSLMVIYSSLKQINCLLEYNLFRKLYLQNQLFKLHCYSLLIQNAQFFNLRKLAVFYLFEINQIIIDSVIFENSQQQYKVPVSQFCADQVQFKNQLIQVIGFQKISLSNIKIINQFCINYSLMEISFSTQFIIDTIGQVILENVQFIGNIILKNRLAYSLSLFQRYSEYNLKIKLSLSKTSQINKLMNCKTHKLIYYRQVHQTVFCKFIIYIVIKCHNLFNQFIYYSKGLIQSKKNEFNYLIYIQNIELRDLYLNFQFGCKDSVFSEIIAFASSIFQIKTQGQGIIKIKNVIDSVSTNLKDSGGSGCISIDSTNSLLSIDLKQIKFTNMSIEWRHHYLLLYLLQNNILFVQTIKIYIISFPQ
ncbi:unnamed protein product [Paramecium octaurelia]|uniref:Uncharacterized protein n=1 Tax=Paramecium octaurelia TaxID=43137 RepID=A0A8S1YQF9_PAROT|nr:unnamed protein product [Paramecium octaurelia]